jgi:hypothetical protein
MFTNTNASALIYNESTGMEAPAAYRTAKADDDLRDEAVSAHVVLQRGGQTWYDFISALMIGLTVGLMFGIGVPLLQSRNDELPAPEPYFAVARAFDVGIADVRLVAAHSWDVS